MIVKTVPEPRSKQSTWPLLIVVVSLLVVSFSLTAQAAEYRVQPGDSLWLITQRFGITLAELRTANDRWHDALYPGDVLIIPVAGSAATSRGGSRPNSSDVTLLAQMIMAEARGEPYEGKVAVGAVVMNRLKHPSFPSTLLGVLYETNAFEPILNGSFYSQSPDQQCINAATAALAGTDPTGGALYFYNPVTARSAWIFSRPTITKIGNHVFAL